MGRFFKIYRYPVTRLEIILLKYPYMSRVTCRLAIMDLYRVFHTKGLNAYEHTKMRVDLESKETSATRYILGALLSIGPYYCDRLVFGLFMQSPSLYGS